MLSFTEIVILGAVAAGIMGRKNLSKFMSSAQRATSTFMKEVEKDSAKKGSVTFMRIICTLKVCT